MIPMLNRKANGAHVYEDEAMQIVLAVKHDFAPDLDDNDGGELLGWILQLCDEVHRRAASGLLGDPEGPQQTEKAKS